jgi:hypothetical protein
MKHTCDTAASGSEHSENVCAACQEERKRSALPQGYGDLMGEWLMQVRGARGKNRHHGS